MRRFLFKSPAYKGFVEAIYDTDSKLFRMNFSSATGITPTYINSFKSRIPVLAENVEEAFAHVESVKFEEVDFEVTFDDFKREYPYNRNMHLVEPEWPKITSSEQYSILIGSIAYAKYCNRNPWYKPMLPQRFIKDKEYRNDWNNL